MDSPAAAAALIRRSVLSQSIHELWGRGDTYDELHASVRSDSAHLWPAHAAASWRFNVDSYRGARTQGKIVDIINSFSYLPLAGPIRMRGADTELVVLEHWADCAVPLGLELPERLYLGRVLASSPRADLLARFDLKRRRYISTTSMDSELALVTANIALAGPGRLFYDPFVGTGSFPVAAAQWGALAWGSDIDGRAVRGDEQGDTGRTLRGNFAQYGLLAGLADTFSADITNSPIRRCPLGSAGAGTRWNRRWLDGIVCDPPYGVREGLRVLGVRNDEKQAHVVKAGMEMYKDLDFIPPKKPYSFLAMLDDLLTFAAETLVDDGRLAFWMPTANDELLELAVPTHPCMELVTVCVQTFNKCISCTPQHTFKATTLARVLNLPGLRRRVFSPIEALFGRTCSNARYPAFYLGSRRLIAYRRIPDDLVDAVALCEALERRAARESEGRTADELNPFRRGYFTKFKTDDIERTPSATH
ncbi:hypothetical protein RB601_005115 [Gaeumannomyces tritici]